MYSHICVTKFILTPIGLYYINAYGHEVHPSPNPDYILNLSSNDVLVYSCGSLWTRCDICWFQSEMLNIFTSIIPCLSLRGVATAIARSRSLHAKVLLRRCSLHFVHLPKRSKFVVNSQNDRETENYTAVDYIRYSDMVLLRRSISLISP